MHCQCVVRATTASVDGEKLVVYQSAEGITESRQTATADTKLPRKILVQSEQAIQFNKLIIIIAITIIITIVTISRIQVVMELILSLLLALLLRGLVCLDGVRHATQGEVHVACQHRQHLDAWVRSGRFGGKHDVFGFDIEGESFLLPLTLLLIQQLIIILKF